MQYFFPNDQSIIMGSITKLEGEGAKALQVKQADFIESLNNKYNEAKSKCENSNSSRRWRGGFSNFFKNECIKEKSLKILFKLKLSLYKKVIELKLNSKNGIEANKSIILDILNKMKKRL